MLFFSDRTDRSIQQVIQESSSGNVNSNDATDVFSLGLRRFNGSKTFIHLTHIPYVNGMLAVTMEVNDNTQQVLRTIFGLE